VIGVARRQSAQRVEGVLGKVYTLDPYAVADAFPGLQKGDE
jgi:hypothetical protein